MSKELTVKLPNGIELKGDPKKVTETAEKLGVDLLTIFPEKDYYKSETKGFVKYSDMEVNHLKNAAVKKMTPYLKDLVKNSATGSSFVAGLTTLRGVDEHVTLVAALHELSKRV